MAFGFKTSYEANTLIEGFENWQVIALATGVFKKLGWGFAIINETHVTASTGFSWKSYGEQVTLYISGDELLCKSECVNGELMDGGRNKKNIEDRFLPQFLYIKESYPSEQLQQDALQLKTKNITEQEGFAERLENGNLTAIEKISLGAGGQKITYAIIAINVLVFILMAVVGVHIFAPEADDIIAWGGNMEAFSAGGQPWRLITCVFIHVGVVHLLFNMYGLYVIGRYLEPLLGKWKFLLAYLCTGILASIASIWWNDTRVSAGASGAIFGMFGLFLALLTTNYIQKHARKAMLQSIAIFIGYSLLSGMREGVDNAAHIGGLISGLVLGYAYYLFDLRITIIDKSSTLVSATITTCTLAIALVYLLAVKNDSLKFQKTVIALGRMEKKAIEQMTRLQYFKDEEKAAKVIQDSTLPEWNRFKLMIDETHAYELNKPLQQKRDLLMQYAELRLYQTELVYNALLDHTGIDADKLQFVMEKLETISASLK